MGIKSVLAALDNVAEELDRRHSYALAAQIDDVSQTLVDSQEAGAEEDEEEQE